MKRWRLNSIATRIAVTIALAIVLGVGVEIMVGVASQNYFDSRYNPRQKKDEVRVRWFAIVTSASPRHNIMLISARIATIVHIIEQTPQGERAHVLAALAEPWLEVAVRDTPMSDPGRAPSPRLNQIRELIETQVGDTNRTVRVTSLQPPLEPFGAGETQPPPEAAKSDGLLVEIALSDGHWLIIRMLDYIAEDAWWRITMFLTPLVVLVGLLSVWTARWLATPISAFAAAAQRLGVDKDAPPLTARGPHELRIAIGAFNQMQDRLRRFISDRTQMVAAMSHDLKTPLTRLRLRAEFVGDHEQQRKMLADLDEMTAMIESTLAFASDEAQREPRMLVDLGALLESVCENAGDAGGAVSVEARHGIDVTCRPTAISRLIANLIDNAVKYGGSARATLERAVDRVIVTIEDNGPGIPPDEREKVFAPFYRLESSRNRETGGAGLGLAIARTIAREHGGDIMLATAGGGGLRVRLELPA
jgi:signal transduction histidine kinase